MLDLPTPVVLVGVNEDGHQVDDYNAPAAFCAGRDLPLLEENLSDGVWASWAVTYRDVVILDDNNEVIEVFNLTDNDLSDTANYEALRDILATAAGG
jgi:hypothetical protein